MNFKMSASRSTATLILWMLACEFAGAYSVARAVLPLQSAQYLPRTHLLGLLRMQEAGTHGDIISCATRRAVVKLGVAGIMPTISKRPAAARDGGAGQKEADALRQRLQGDIARLRQGDLEKTIGFSTVKKRQVMYPEWMVGTWHGEESNHASAGQ